MLTIPPFKIIFLKSSLPTHGKKGMQRCKPKITFTESGPKVETQDWAERPAMCSCSSQFRQSAINGKSAFNGMQSCNQASGKMHFHCNHRLRSMPLRSMGDATSGRQKKTNESINSVDNLNKVNRCLARYSPRAITTNRPANRAPKKPAWPGPNWPKMPI